MLSRATILLAGRAAATAVAPAAAFPTSAAACMAAQRLPNFWPARSQAPTRGLAQSAASADPAPPAGAGGGGADGDVRPGLRSQVHFRRSANLHPLEGQVFDKQREWPNPMGHPVWSKEEVENVEQVFLEPKTVSDKLAWRAVQALRWSFDLLAGFKTGPADEAKYLRRMIFLETVAGVPGMMGGMSRHLRSLRRMQRDHGRLHTLLEEAENERMHLLTFLQVRQPGPVFRACVFVTQALLCPIYFTAYSFFPNFCSRWVGYIEHEAVHTYTTIIEDLRAGKLPEFEALPAPQIAIGYWQLAPDAMFEDVLLAVRKDEATHRDVNHTFAELGMDDVNPFVYEHEKK